MTDLGADLVRPRLYLLTAVLTSIVVGGVIAMSGALAGLIGDDPDPDPGAPTGWQVPTAAGPLATPAPSPAPEAEPAPPLEPAEPRLELAAEVKVSIDGFLSWAALDRRTGALAGSKNLAATSSTESMIKAWIVADYLRLRTEAGEEPSKRELTDGSRAIRDSHNGAAERLYQAAGENDAIERMIDLCELTDTEIYPYWWSRTEISARDTVRLGECLANGTAAGPDWTDWVLDEMRQVRGTTAAEDQPTSDGGEGGRWGIIDGLPPQTVDGGVAIKNGWTAIGRTNSWHIACLAITDDWVMAVLMRYPADKSLDYGAERCARVAEQLITDQPVPVDPAARQ